jgi:hypothetical protein
MQSQGPFVSAAGQSGGRPAIPRTREGVPAFDEDDVRTYISAHPPLLTIFGEPPVVAEVRFLSAAEALALVGERQARPSVLPIEPLCLVELLGPFNVPDPLRPLGRVAPIASRLRLLFDARSGELLTWKPADR